MRSSPLRAVEEETGYAASAVGSDLWESASLDYPGREELYMDQDDDFEPVIRKALYNADQLWLKICPRYGLSLSSD
jgi:hypothetical protein